MATSIMDFSPNGEYFAYCGVEGTLKVWNTATNTLKQEYVPSSHLSATCTCLQWRHGRKQIENSPGSKKKKRKSDIDNSLETPSDLISLGTASGSVLLYSVKRGDLQTKWDNGHNSTVSGLSWCKYSDVMYSCSHDSFIVEWDILTGNIRQRWKGDGPVYSMCLCRDDTMLLTASHSIKLWDLATRKVIQTFSGHATEVFRLLEVGSQSAVSDARYFVSAARDDRFVNVWQSKNCQKSKIAQKALASLQLPDAAISMSIHGPSDNDGAYLFSVVTITGWFLLFKQVLNGECKKPLQPKVKLQIASSNVEVSKLLAILCAMIIKGEKLLLSYGNHLKPSFEKISYSSLESDSCLVREDPVEKVSQVNEVSKVKRPIMSDDVKHLTPGQLVPLKPSQATSSKKRRKRHTSVDMTVEERLDVMGLGEKSDKPDLKTTSSAILLSQGLQSKDQSIINHVLQNKNPSLIRNTIKKLPIPLIIPLVDELSRRMRGHAQASSSVIAWTKSLLTIHSSYLMTFPELVQNLSTLYQMMDSRVTMFSRLSKLQGKLELVLSQVSNQSEADDASENIEALVTLQDESSDDDMIIPGNEDDDTNWEDEDSEMDAAGESSDDDDGMGEDLPNAGKNGGDGDREMIDAENDDMMIDASEDDDD